MVFKPQGSVLAPVQSFLYSCCGCTWFVPTSEQGSASETIICCRAGGPECDGEVFTLLELLSASRAQGRQLLGASYPFCCQSSQPGQRWGAVRASLTPLPGVSHSWHGGSSSSCQCGPGKLRPGEKLSLVGPSTLQSRIQSSTKTQFTSLWAWVWH